MVVGRCVDSGSLKARISIFRKAIEEKVAESSEIVKVMLQFC